MGYPAWTKSLAYAVFAVVILPAVVLSQSTAPTVTCMDGTTSTATGSGACSSHGGVDKSKGTTTKTTTPANGATGSGVSPTSPTTSSTTSSTAKSSSPKSFDSGNPNGAYAKCKDGTYWHDRTRNGTCSGHGGVDTWLRTSNGSPVQSKSQLQP